MQLEFTASPHSGVAKFLEHPVQPITVGDRRPARLGGALRRNSGTGSWCRRNARRGNTSRTRRAARTLGTRQAGGGFSASCLWPVYKRARVEYSCPLVSSHNPLNLLLLENGLAGTERTERAQHIPMHFGFVNRH